MILIHLYSGIQESSKINKLQVEKLNYILFRVWLILSRLQVPSLSISTSPQQDQGENVTKNSCVKITGRSLSYYHHWQKGIKLVKLVEFIYN